MSGVVDYLSNLKPADIVVQAKSIEAYLQGINPKAQLSSLQGIGVPVVANIFAATGTMVDLLSIHASAKPSKEQSTHLAINLIGLIPSPVDEAHARMALRPMLALAMLAKGGKLSATDIAKLASHLNDKTAGDLETFLNNADSKLDAILSAAATLGSTLASDLATRMANAGISIPRPTLPDTSSLPHDPNATFSDWISIIGQIGQTATIAPPPAISLGQSIPNASFIALAAKISAAVAQATPEIKKLLKSLKDGLKAAHKQGNAAIPVSHTGEYNGDIKGGTLEYVSLQSLPVSEASNCPAQKQGDAASATCSSITFSSGAERVAHTDFITTSTYPIIWRRQYTSQNISQEHSPFGARWNTPYSAQFIANEHHLSYCGADGRINHYGILKDGQIYHDAINSLNITRVSADMLVIGRGTKSEWIETYERDPQQSHSQIYRLTMMSDVKNNQTIGIRYDHSALTTGQRVLSDVLTKKGETILSHIRTVINPSGMVTEIWQIKDNQPTHQLARYHYDNHRNLIMAQDENAQYWEYSYGETPQHHLIHRYTDRTGRGQNIRYNSNSPNAKAIREWADDGSFDTQLIYDKRIRKVTVIDALGAATEHYYDIYGFTYRSVYANGLSEWFQRDTRKNVTQHSHTNGSNSQYRYDKHDNLIQTVNPEGAITRFQYNPEHQLIGIQDPEGGVWKRDYDPKGNLSEQIDPLGNVTTFEYNKDQQPTVITDAKGGKKQLTYTALNQIASYTDCSGKTSTWSYDKQARLIKQSNAAGETIQYTYSTEGAERGQLKTIIHPDQSEEHLTHDAERRLLTHIDPKGQRTLYEYTLSGQIKQRTDAAGHTIGYTWDKAGRLTSLTNANQAQYRFQYDTVGQLITEQAFDGSTTEYQYDAATGLLKQIKDTSLLTSLAFDKSGRITTRVVMDRATTAKQTETFAYDGNGQLIQASNSASKLSWYYDLAGQLTREHQQYKLPEGQHTAIWQHQYDALGNRTTTIRPDGTRTEWLTYGTGHVHGIMLNGQETIAFERDDLHREIERAQANQIQQQTVYDPAGRLKQQLINYVDSKQDINTSLNQRSYQYDQLGQLTDISDTRRGGLNYVYDPIGRLLSASSTLGQELFAFDPAGNIAPVAASTANEHPNQPHQQTTQSPLAKAAGEGTARTVLDNLLKEYIGTHYEYDQRGNMIKRTHNGQVTTFVWDNFNHMSSASTNEMKVNFYYDALGRRIAKHSGSTYTGSSMDGSGYAASVRKQQNEAGGYGYTLYGWDGDILAWESSMATSKQFEGKPTHAQTIHYIYEPNSFVPMIQASSLGSINLLPTPDYTAIAQSEQGYDIDRDPVWQHQPERNVKPFDAIAFYQCDHLGTPQELTDMNGEIAWAAEYKAWGLAYDALSKAGKAAGLKQPFRFQGQYYDNETGLHYNRHRYYDPHSGRFVSKDPIGLAGGLNVHQYANNPVAWIDPMGLQSAQQRRTQRRAMNTSAGQANYASRSQAIGNMMDQYNHGEMREYFKGLGKDDDIVYGNLNGSIAGDLFTCTKWKCTEGCNLNDQPYNVSNGKQCSLGGCYKRSTDFNPLQSNIDNPPDGCVCVGKTRKMYQYEPETLSPEDVIDAARKAAQRYWKRK